MRLSGNALVGVDEFMLRTGHLRVLAHIAAQFGGSRSKTERFMAEFLRDVVQIPADEATAQYLGTKHLCPVKGKDDRLTTSDRKSRFRYPDVMLTEDVGRFSFASDLPSVTLTWQDAKLADSMVPSKVGAITTEAKSGSKTGLSHIFDWAEAIGLVSQSAQAGPIARIVATGVNTAHKLPAANPYVPGPEHLPIAFLLITADADVFARFVCRLSRLTSDQFPLKKRDAARLFGSVVEQIDSESISAGYLTSSQRFRLSNLLRDLKTSAQRSRTGLGESSTAWHRTGSRLESYVDFGLLQKSVNSSKEKFEYIYYPTTRLQVAADQIEQSSTIEEWVGEFLTIVASDRGAESREYDDEEIRHLLKSVVETIKSPTSVLPLDAITLYAMEVALLKQKPSSYSYTRRQIEQFARNNEDVARLARGRSGRGAEFLTINTRTLNSHG
jgi:hypothetical protein